MQYELLKDFPHFNGTIKKGVIFTYMDFDLFKASDSDNAIEKETIKNNPDFFKEIVCCSDCERYKKRIDTLKELMFKI